MEGAAIRGRTAVVGSGSEERARWSCPSLWGALDMQVAGTSRRAREGLSSISYRALSSLLSAAMPARPVFDRGCLSLVTMMGWRGVFG